MQIRARKMSLKVITATAQMMTTKKAMLTNRRLIEKVGKKLNLTHGLPRSVVDHRPSDRLLQVEHPAEDDGHVFPFDRLLGAEGPVGIAEDDALLQEIGGRCPVSAALGHIGEAGRARR